MGGIVTAPATIGRDAELVELRSVAEGRSGAAVLEGEPGIGKTHLLDELGRRGGAAGLAVWRARCDELDCARPLAPLLTAIPGLADARLPSERAELLDGLAAHIAAEERLLVAAQRHIETLLVEPALLLVDDVQWADRATLLLLHRLARDERRLRLVCAARPLPRSSELAVLIGAVDTVHLRPLSADDARQLAETLTGPLGDDQLRTIERAHGHPLLVLVLAAAVRDGNDPATLRSLADAVARSAGATSPEAQQVLRLAAVQGSRVSLSLLAAVARRPVVELLPLVSELLAAGLLVERGEDLVFRHDLVREAVASQLPAAVRRALHVETALALETSGAPLLAVAAHLARGAEPGDVRAAARLREAGAVVAMHNPAAALELLERASHVARGTEEADRAEAERCVALAWCARCDEAEATAGRLLARSSDAAVRVLCHRGLAAAFVVHARFSSAADHLTHALEEPGLTASQRARLLAELAFAEHLAPNRTGAAEHAGAALAFAESSGDVPTMQLALTTLSCTTARDGSYSEAVRFAERALALTGDDDSGVWDQTRVWVAELLAAKDRFADARSLLLAGRAEAQRRGLAWRAAQYAFNLGIHALDVGDLDAADRELETSLREWGEDHAYPAVCHAARGRVALARGDLPAARTELERARRALAGLGEPSLREVAVRILEAALFVEEAQIDEALRALREARAIVDAVGASLVYLDIGPELVRLLVGAGVHEEADEVLSIVEAAAARLDAPAATGHALLTGAHRSQVADDYLTAVAAFAESPRRLDHARACLHAGAALAAAGRRADAVEMLDDALRLADACGAHGLAARTRGALRALGVRPGARGRRTRATHGWESLTPAETRVVELVADGLSNPEIAARLFVSRGTVESHLKRVYAKLGMASRFQLATAWGLPRLNGGGPPQAPEESA